MASLQAEGSVQEDLAQPVTCGGVVTAGVSQGQRVGSMSAEKVRMENAGVGGVLAELTRPGSFGSGPMGSPRSPADLGTGSNLHQ